jgi:hypothetical protein
VRTVKALAGSDNGCDGLLVAQSEYCRSFRSGIV